MGRPPKNKDSEISEKQIKALAFIDSFTKTYFDQPSFKEIAEAAGLQAKSAAGYLVAGLVRRGLLEKITIPGRAKRPVMSMRLTKLGLEAISVKDPNNNSVTDVAPVAAGHFGDSIIRATGINNGVATIAGTNVPVWLVVKRFDHCMHTTLGGYDNVYAALQEYFPSIPQEKLSDAIDYSIRHQLEIAEDTINNDLKVTMV